MNAVTGWLFVTALAASVLTVPVNAQVSQKDSAGIRITVSASPSRPADAVVLASSPRVVIGARTDGDVRLQSIRHVAVLSDGRIVHELPCGCRRCRFRSDRFIESVDHAVE